MEKYNYNPITQDLDMTGDGAGDVINNYGVAWNDETPLPPQELEWGGIVGDIDDQTDLKDELDMKADKSGHLSLERLRHYLYRVTFDTLPEDNGGESPVTGGCSSYVQGGKLFRNLDYNYDDAASFIVRTRDFEGMSFLTGLVDGAMDDDLIEQLPYRVVDGRNNDGIMVSAHVIFNDWRWTWAGDRSVSLTRLPYLVLSRVKSMATMADDLDGVLGNVYASQGLQSTGYLLQVLVTDGVTTYALMPPTSEGQSYVMQNITANPKLANFRWVSRGTVTRSDADLQKRPTGVERFNAMPCDLEDLRFTKCYEAATRLSEFIGIDGTDKDSTDEELTAIYDLARAEYLQRQRDGKTWQTMHSVVYGSAGMEKLFIQENWEDNYASTQASIDELEEVTATALNDLIQKIESETERAESAEDSLAQYIDTIIGELEEVVAFAFTDLDTRSLSDAPSDGKQYPSKDGDWSEMNTEGTIHYDKAQTLTDAQKAQARANIGISIYNGEVV